ncbi:MAG: DUF4350 domain-containing protein [Pirellulales bacterium]
MKPPVQHFAVRGLLALLCCAAAAGCQQDLDTTYGVQSGSSGKLSVNGLGVLAGMFEQAGHDIRAWRTLSPGLNDADAIVWAPDDFGPPAVHVREWLEDWLKSEHGRTLIYIGRDYDAAIDYLAKLAADTPVDQSRSILARLDSARSRFSARRQTVEEQDADWFSVATGEAPHPVRQLSGPWSRGIEAEETSVEAAGHLVPPDDAETLLSSDRGVLVSRLTNARDFGSTGELIVVENGSFLLNLPLVNHAHRRLAARLIESIGRSPQTVVFLQASRPPITDTDPEPSGNTAFALFDVWPVNYILAHLGVLGILFAVSRFAIFGLPREMPESSQSDFGKHIDALGELLRNSHDVRFAQAALAQYDQLAVDKHVQRRPLPESAAEPDRPQDPRQTLEPPRPAPHSPREPFA